MSDAAWNVLVFLNAKNNLEKYSFPNFKQMAAIGSTDDVNILVEYGRPKSRPGGVALERLRVLDTWVAARQKESIAGSGVHEMLTHVVDEVNAIGQTLGKELLGG